MFYDRLVPKMDLVAKLQGRSPPELRAAKLFLFDADQAEVFLESGYELENYPHFVFDNLFINFTRPLVVGKEGRRFHGVHIQSTELLQIDEPKAVLAVQKSSLRALDEKAERTEAVKGCIAEWYESFSRRDQPRMIHTFGASFTPDSFPGFLHEPYIRLQGELDQAEIIHQLTVSLLYFLSCENVEFQRHAPKGSRLSSLRSKGQRSAYPFYTIAFGHGSSSSPASSSGSGPKHGHRYDVAGHFRHLRDERYSRNPDGTYRVIWVRGHQRGLNAEIYVPACRRVHAA